MLTLNIFTPCSSVFIVNFEHVIADWNVILFEIKHENVSNL